MADSRGLAANWTYGVTVERAYDALLEITKELAPDCGLELGYHGVSPRGETMREVEVSQSPKGLSPAHGSINFRIKPSDVNGTDIDLYMPTTGIDTGRRDRSALWARHKTLLKFSEALDDRLGADR